MLKLNLGSGSNKIEGFINIDAEESCKPDMLLNFLLHPLPYDSESVDEVVLFHTIEHIGKRYHKALLREIHRVLKPDAQFALSFPEFIKCVTNWIDNYRGKREFWEATLYGRQLYPGDFHVCVMDSSIFSDVLKENGFYRIKVHPEPAEPYNTIISCRKGPVNLSYEEMIKNDMERIKIEK